MQKYLESLGKSRRMPGNLIYELINQHSSIIQYCEQKTQDKDFDLQDFEAAEVCSHTLERTLEGLVGQISGFNNRIIGQEIIKEEDEPEDEGSRILNRTYIVENGKSYPYPYNRERKSSINLNQAYNPYNPEKESSIILNRTYIAENKILNQTYNPDDEQREIILNQTYHPDDEKNEIILNETKEEKNEINLTDMEKI